MLLPSFRLTSSCYASVGRPDAVSFSVLLIIKELSILFSDGAFHATVAWSDLLLIFGTCTNKDIAGYAMVTNWPQNRRGLTQQSVCLSHSLCLELVSPESAPRSHSGLWRLPYKVTLPFQKKLAPAYAVERKIEHEELSPSFSLLLTWQSCLGNPGGEKDMLNSKNCLYILRSYPSLRQHGELRGSLDLAAKNCLILDKTLGFPGP